MSLLEELRYTDDQKSMLLKDLIRRWPIHFSGSQKYPFPVTYFAKEMRVDFSCRDGGLFGHMINYIVWITGINGESIEVCLGHLHKNIKVSRVEICDLHKHILPYVEFVYNQDAEDCATVTSVVPGIRIEMFYVDTSEWAITVCIGDKRVEKVTNDKKILAAQEAVKLSIATYMISMGYPDDKSEVCVPASPSSSSSSPSTSESGHETETETP